MRTVVDTSVWISALINPAGAPAQILDALRDERFELIASEPVLAELERVLGRPRFARFGVTPTKIAALLALLRERAELVEVTGTIHLCRDPNDDAFIETALAGASETLVSRDDLKGASDLITSLRERGVAVVTVRHFLEALRGAPLDS